MNRKLIYLLLFQRKPVVPIGFTLLHMHTYTLCVVVTLYAPVVSSRHSHFLNLATCDDSNKDAVLPLPLGMYKTIIMAELQLETSASGQF